MAVMDDHARTTYGGAIKIFEPGTELTFENDWIPNRGWFAPTFVTLRLTPALGGTLVELFHHGFEHTGGDVGAEHAGYEAGWGMMQLSALKKIAERETASVRPPLQRPREAPPPPHRNHPRAGSASRGRGAPRSGRQPPERYERPAQS